MRYILTYEAKRMTHSQEEQEKVSSSQDTLLLREERSSVSALVNGINACLSGADVSENNESLKVEKMAATSIQEECQQQNVYPWFKGFEETSRSSLSCKNIKKLESLMTTFLGYVTESVKVCYTRPNRAAKLRKCLNQTLLFFHIYYQDVRKSGKRSLYLDLMTELVAMYIDMEIKAACRQKEKVKKITSRITSALYLLLDKSEDHILDAILKAKLINKQNKDVCLPVLGKIVNQVPLPLSEMSYVRYLLIFKLFKKVIQGTRKEKQQKSEEESRINKLAVLKLKPPDNFVERAKIFTDVLPKIPPKSKKNITHFFMQAKLNLKNACAAFLKGVKEFQESLYGSTDKELFCSKQLSVFPINNDKVDGGAGCLNGFSSDMWASVDLESLVQNSQVRDVSSCKKECGKKVKEKVKKKKKNKNIDVKDKKEDIEKIRKKKLKKNKILGVCGDTISMLEDKVLGSKKGKGDKKKKKKANVKAELTSSESTDESTSLPETSTIVDSLYKDLSAARKTSPESLSSLSRSTGTSNASEDSQNVVSTGTVQKQEISNYEEMSDVSDTIEISASLLQNERPTTTVSTPMPTFGHASAVCTAVPPPLLPSYTSPPPPPPPPTPVASLEQPTTTTPQGGPHPPQYLNQTELFGALHLKHTTDSRSASPAIPSIHASSHVSACSSSVSSPHRNVPSVCAGLPVGFTPSIPPPPLPTYPPPPPPPLPSSSGLHGHTPVSYLPPLPSSPAPLQPPLPRSPAPPLPPLPSAPAPSSSGFSLPPMSVPPPLSFLSTIPPPPTPPSVLSHGIHHPSVLLPSVLNSPRPPPTPPPTARPTATPPPHSLVSSVHPSQTPPPPPPPTPPSTPLLFPPPIPPTLPPSRTPPLPNSSTYPPLSISSSHHPLFTLSVSAPTASSSAPSQPPRASTTSSRSISLFSQSVNSRPPMVTSLSGSTPPSDTLDSPQSPPRVSSPLNACSTSAIPVRTASPQSSSQGVTLSLSNTISTQSFRATCTPPLSRATPPSSRVTPTLPPSRITPTPPPSRTPPTSSPSHTTATLLSSHATPTPPSRITPTPPSRTTPTPPSRTTPTPPSRTTPTPPLSHTIPPLPPSRTTPTPPPPRTTPPPSRTTPTPPPSRVTLTPPPSRTTPTPSPSRPTPTPPSHRSPTLPSSRATPTPPPSRTCYTPPLHLTPTPPPSCTTPTPTSHGTPPLRTTLTPPPLQAIPKLPLSRAISSPPPSRTTPPSCTTTSTSPSHTITTMPSSRNRTTPPPSRITLTPPPSCTTLVTASSHISVTSPPSRSKPLPIISTSTLFPLQTSRTPPLPRAVFTSSCTVSSPPCSVFASSPSRAIQTQQIFAKQLSSCVNEDTRASSSSSSSSPQSPPPERSTTPPLRIVSSKVSSRIVVSPTSLPRKSSPPPSHTPPSSPSSVCIPSSETPAPSSPCSFTSTVPSSPSSPPPPVTLLTSTPCSEVSDSDVLKRSILSPVVTVAAPTPVSPSSPMSVCADEEVSVTVTVASPDCAPSPVPPLTSGLGLTPSLFLEKPTTTTQAVNYPSKITVVPTALLTASHSPRHKDTCESSPAHLVSASTIPCFASRVISPSEERLEDVGAEVEVGEEAESGVEADTITSQEEEEESRENGFIANNRILSVKQEIGDSVNDEKMTCDSAGEQFMSGTEEGSEEGRVVAPEVCIKEEISYPEEQFNAVNTVIAPVAQNRDTVIASGSCESLRPSSSGNEKKCLVTSQICKPEVHGNEAIASCGNKQEKICMDTVSPRPVRDVLVSDIQRSISKDEESEAASYCDSSIQNVPLSVNNDEMSSVPMDIDPEMLESFTATQVRSSNDDLVYDIIGVGEGVLFGSDNGLGGLCLGAHQEEADSPAIEVFSSSDTRSLCDLMLNLRESQLDLSQYGFERPDIVSYQDTVFHNGEIVRVRGVEENARQEESMMFAVENYDDDSDVDDDNKSLNSSYNMQGFRGRPRTADKRPPSGVAPRGFTVIVDDDKDVSDVSPSSRIENDSVPSSPIQSNTTYSASNSLFSDVNDSIGYGKARAIRSTENISSSGIASVPHSTTPKQTRINTTRCYTPMQQTLQSSSSESREDSSAEESPTKVVVQKPVEEPPRSVVHHAINANRTIELKLHQLSRESIARGFPDALDARKADSQKAEGLRAQETTKPAQRGMLLDTTSYCGKMIRPSIDTMYRGVPLQPPAVPTSIPYPAISNTMAIGKGAPPRMNTYFDCSCPECIAYNFMLMSRYGSVQPRGPPLPLSFHEPPIETDSDKLKSAEKLKSENEELLRRIEESLTNNKCLDAVLDSKYKLELDSSLPPKKRLKTIAAVSNIKSESSDKWESPKEDSFPSYPTKPMISIAELDFSERLFSKHVQRPIKTVMSNNPQRFLPYAYFQSLQQGKELNKVSNDDSLYRSCGGEVSVPMNVPIANTGKEAPIYPYCNTNINQLVSCDKTVKYQQPGSREYTSGKEKITPPISENVNPIKVEVTSNNQNIAANSWEYSGRQFKTPAQLKEIPSVNYYVGMPSIKCDGNKLDSNMTSNSGVYVPKINSVEEGKYGYSQYSKPHALDLSVEESQNIKALKSRKRKNLSGDISSRSRISKRASRNQNVNQNTDPSDPYFPTEKRMHRKHVSR